MVDLVHLLIMIHAFLGVAAALLSFWLGIELKYLSESTYSRVMKINWATIITTWLTYIFAAWYYVPYYGREGGSKSIIKSSDYYWGHAFFTEVKEHWFFMMPLLTIVLFILVRNVDLTKDTKAKKIAMTIAFTMFVIAVLMEGFGAVISMTVRLAKGI